MTYLIIGAVVLLLLLLIVVIALGNKRKKEKTVSFTKEEAPKELTREEKSGNYTATGGFNFAPAKETEPVLLDNQKLDAPQPAAAQPLKMQEPEVKAPAAPAAAPVVPVVPEIPEEPQVDVPVEAPVSAATPIAATPIAQEVAEEVAPEPVVDPDADPEEEPTVEPAGQPDIEQEDEVLKEIPELDELDEETESPVVEEPVEAPTEDKAQESPVAAEQETTQEAEEAAEAAAVTVDAAERALEETPVPSTAPAPAPAPLDDIEPAAGRLGKLRGKLVKSNNFLGQSVLGMLTAGDLDEDAWEEIEDQLIMADLGTATTVKVVESLRAKIAERGVESEAQAKAMLRETLIEAGKPELDRSIKAMPYEGKPAVVLIVGVNGTGKTTTTGKLARVLVSMGHKVLLGAADTFRAAAADQLETWGRRVGAETVRGAEGADPASVAFDAVAKGVETQADVVLIDTAGRLHTSVGLMDQLGKVKRVVEKKAKVDEVLLVLDATVGQNGLMQARTFRDVVDITGVVLTKLDGTAKGGIVFQVQEELGVPVKLVGLGEGADHLAPFEVESFVDALLA
ncbi:Signal recognition particle receptor FtsY [Corynebacterium kalinowskii]|uniref:Signal recognition particle receptor FtsY n=2 Tax=Corynebacterium kalinowskii TaxID=2675216 RepID=A0A6B8VAZ5_9CORY|nr:Signal recognition particle receptor FtsY [Corynebacterium kalinowskii]